MTRARDIHFEAVRRFQDLDAADGSEDLAISIAEANGLLAGTTAAGTADAIDTNGDGRIDLAEWAHGIHGAQEGRRWQQAMDRFRERRPGKHRDYELRQHAYDTVRLLYLSAGLAMGALDAAAETATVTGRSSLELLHTLLPMATDLDATSASPAPIGTLVAAIPRLAEAGWLHADAVGHLNTISAQLVSRGFSPGEIAHLVDRLAARFSSHNPLLLLQDGLEIDGALFDGTLTKAELQSVWQHVDRYHGMSRGELSVVASVLTDRKAAFDQYGPARFGELIRFIANSKTTIDVEHLSMDTIQALARQLEVRGLTRFGRFSASSARAITTPATHAATGALLLTVDDDHNGALYNQAGSFAMVAEDGYHVHARQLSDDRLPDFDSIPDASLDLVVVSAHSGPRAIPVANGAVIDTSDAQWALLAQKLKPGARVIFLSCSLGRLVAGGENLQQFFQRMLQYVPGVEIFASPENTAPCLRRDADGRLSPQYFTKGGQPIPPIVVVTSI